MINRQSHRSKCLSGALALCMGQSMLACADSKPAPVAPGTPVAKASASPSGEPDLSRETACVVWAKSREQGPSWSRYELVGREVRKGQELLARAAEGGQLLYEKHIEHELDAQGHPIRAWASEDGSKGRELATYDNEYVGGKLVAVTEKAGAATHHFAYGYDADGRIQTLASHSTSRAGKQLRSYVYDGRSHLTEAKVEVRDGDLVKVATHSLGYDNEGHLVSHDVDGLLNEGGTADGKVDYEERWAYAPDGSLASYEARGQRGDVPVPGAETGAPLERVLFSPGCRPLAQLWPALYRLDIAELPPDVKLVQ